MPENRLDAEFIKKQLSQLVEYYSQPDTGKVEFWQLLAQRLSLAIGKNDPWTWRYVQGVYQGTLQPSRDFGKAVMALGAIIDGANPLFVKAEMIQVYAIPGSVKPGSFVMGETKVCRKCTSLFVPNVPWREECYVCSPPRERKGEN